MLTDRPVCDCHGEPCYWQRDPRLPRLGRWICAVRKRALNREYHERHRETRLAARQEKQLERWHAPGGGYVQRRRRTLAAQRSMILARLDTLREEAERC